MSSAVANGNGNTTTSTSNGSVKAIVHDKASDMASYAQRSLDRVVPPKSRQRAYNHTSNFASARPILFSFIVSQLLLSFLPLLLFVTFSLSSIGFALGAAVLFSLFWIGIALLLLIPALLVTSSIAVLVWGWAVGSFLVARWLYNHSPVGVQADVQVNAAGKRLNVVKNEDGLDGKVENIKK